ncbi:unnamed protein product [marine sediment metagenome]|uniref:Uncharacterized protein n=1 Tax=marine sediment metagenome TaxID=412755 RepID=X1AYS9_9ZZZZ
MSSVPPESGNFRQLTEDIPTSITEPYFGISIADATTSQISTFSQILSYTFNFFTILDIFDCR